MMRRPCHLRLVAPLFVGALFSALSVTARPADDLPALLDVIERGQGGEVDRAAGRLAYLGADRAGPPLRELLESPVARARINAASALVIVRDPDASRALGKAVLEDDDWEVRRNACAALGALRRPSSAAVLGRALRDDANARVRRACAVALGETGGGAEALARAASKEPDLELRLVALDSLARGMDPSAAKLVRPLLKASSGLVRFAAARALGWQGDPAARTFLAAAVDSPDPENVMRAVTVLSDVPKPWAPDLLEKVLLKGADPARLAAAVALARRGDARGTRALARLEAEGGETGLSAAQSLDTLGVDAKARAALRREATPR